MRLTKKTHKRDSQKRLFGSLFCKRDLSCNSQKRPKLLNNVCRSFLTYFSSLRARLAVHLVCGVPVSSGSWNCVDTGEEYYADHVWTLFSADGLSVYICMGVFKYVYVYMCTYWVVCTLILLPLGCSSG